MRDSEQITNEPSWGRHVPRIPMASLVFFLAFIVMSPLFAAAGIKGIIFLLVAVGALVANGRIAFGQIQKSVYLFGGVYLFLAFAMAFYWGTEVPLLFAAMYVSTVIVVANVRKAEVERIVVYATVFLAAVIVLAWIGQIYFFAGGGPIAGIRNPDGRDNLLYLSTLSNASGETWMRASGIYDEPGALSFFICALCAMRETLRKSRNVTALLLVGGLVTLSIAHIIYMVFHLAAHVLTATTRKGLATILVFAAALSLLLLSGRVQSVLQEIVVERAINYQTGEVSNTRDEAVSTVYREMTPAKMMFGFGFDCVARVPDCTKRLGGDFGENPLTPIVYGGLVLAWPYYLAVLGFTIFGVTNRNRWYSIGIAVLLLQRPYVLEFPYSATVFLLILVLLFERQRAARGIEEAHPYPKFPSVAYRR